jgi:sodium transport system permease protein
MRVVVPEWKSRMRWSVVRLITLRETHDLLRDRRTVMVILVLPAVLYPLFGLAALMMAKALTSQPTTVGVVGMDHLPTGAADPSGKQPPYPALFADGKFIPAFTASESDLGPLAVKPLTDDTEAELRSRGVDVALVIPDGFAKDLEAGRKPTVRILNRDGDERSKLAAQRLTTIVRKWEDKVREAAFERRNLPKDLDKVFVVEDPLTKKPKEKKAADELRDVFARVFPFILMMWLVAGAIQPAVDVTAGEKERGTMETLLISPAERTEIVAGKFLATTGFAFASVVWNVIWLTGGALGTEWLLGFPIVNLPGLVGCVLLGLPLAMLFSAVCLALGVFARSTKEGQYYLMPLILLTMPLAFWSLIPGAELTPERSVIPVTGALLLQKKLLAVGEPVPWEYLPPVVGGLFVWVLLALWLAVRQFKNEAVLFRESGPEKVGLLRRIFKPRG